MFSELNKRAKHSTKSSSDSNWQLIFVTALTFLMTLGIHQAKGQFLNNPLISLSTAMAGPRSAIGRAPDS